MQNRIGAVPRQLMADMMQAGYIKGGNQNNLQPSSLDLTLTDEAYRMRGSYLPRRGESIAEIISHGSLYKHSLERPLEVHGTYLIRLNESLALPPGIHALASSKSSSGRINLRTHLLADSVPRFDSIPNGYRGSLWIEVIPKSFPVILHPGIALNQLRFFHGDAELSNLEHRIAYDTHKLLRDGSGEALAPNEERVGNGITMTVDLNCDEIIGWRAHMAPRNVLDTAKFDHIPTDFFEPVTKPRDGELTLENGSFYILVTKERIIVPPNLAAEMGAYDPTKGEFRSHYAGFFDPGWGWSADGSREGDYAVLEVCTLGHDFILRDGQPICQMVYERLLTKPDVLYGQDLKSNYTGQRGPRLAKWFKLS